MHCAGFGSRTFGVRFSSLTCDADELVHGYRQAAGSDFSKYDL